MLLRKDFTIHSDTVYIPSLQNTVMMETVTSAKRLKIAHENQLKLNSENTTNASNRRTLHVEGVGMAKSVPDVCHLLISIVSQKMSVTQAKNSVDRRVAYIKQTILNCHIQVYQNYMILAGLTLATLSITFHQMTT